MPGPHSPLPPGVRGECEKCSAEEGPGTAPSPLHPGCGLLPGCQTPSVPMPPHPHLCKVPSAHLSAHLGPELLGEGGLVFTSRS